MNPPVDAATIAPARIYLYRVDVSQVAVDTMNRDKIHIEEIRLDGLMQSVVQRGLLRAGIEVESSDAFVIRMPTPFHKRASKADLSYVLTASESAAKALKPGETIIVESTSPSALPNFPRYYRRRPT